MCAGIFPARLTLFSTGLLQPVPSAPQRPSWLAVDFPRLRGSRTTCSACPFMIRDFLLSIKLCQPSISWEKVPLAADRRAILGRITQLFKPPFLGNTAPILVFEGRHGAAPGRPRQLSVMT